MSATSWQMFSWVRYRIVPVDLSRNPVRLSSISSIRRTGLPVSGFLAVCRNNIWMFDDAQYLAFLLKPLKKFIYSWVIVLEHGVMD